MDIELLRTFLEVNRTRHFGKAADNLYLTQSAVSARVKQLEDALGVTIFERQRNNIRLTAAGQRFISHAETIVGTWQRARQEAGLEDKQAVLLSVSGLSDLWETDLLDWLITVKKQSPDIAIHASTASATALTQQILNGMLDIAFLFEPQSSTELSYRFLKRMNLQMVSTDKDLSIRDALTENYVMIDWGTAYAVNHSKFFPDAPTSSIFMSHGSLALSYILKNGGTAYLPENWCHKLMKSKKLYPVAGTPVIEREIHAVWRTDNPKNPTIQQSLEYFG